MATSVFTVNVFTYLYVDQTVEPYCYVITQTGMSGGVPVSTAHNLIPPSLADLQWQHTRTVSCGPGFPTELQPCTDFDIFFLLHSLRTPFTFQCDHSYGELRGLKRRGGGFNDVMMKEGRKDYYYWDGGTFLSLISEHWSFPACEDRWSGSWVHAYFSPVSHLLPFRLPPPTA